MRESNTNRYIATEAKKVKDNNQEHSSKKPRSSTALCEETKAAVVKFFEDDNISRAERLCVSKERWKTTGDPKKTVYDDFKRNIQTVQNK